MGFVVITTNTKSERDVLFLIRCLFVALGLSVVAGLIAITGIWRPEIHSFIGLFLPPQIGETMYGKRIVTREWGVLSWFLGLDQYFRVNSFFLYATMYAPVLVMLLPIVLWKLQSDKANFRFLLWILLLILALSNLVYTTARMSVVGFLTGAAYYYIKKSKKTVFVLACSGVVILMLYVMIRPWDVSNIERIWQTVLYARGEGSVVSRFGVYKATISGVLERPIFGWGTERDIPDLLFPAGSHSYYLGVLYKYGFAGLLAFLILYWSLWKYTAPLPQDKSRMSSLLQYGRWSLVAAIVNGTTDVLDLDTTTLVIFWILMGILASARFIIIRQDKNTSIIYY